MSTKRKRVPDAEPDSSKKKKGRLSLAEKQKRDVEMQKGEYVVTKLRKAMNPEKKLAAEAFIRLPSRRLEPNFYEKVQNPIDFTTIQVRLKTPDYMNFEEFCEDIDLLIKNTLGYYKKDSEEYKDMKIIEQVFEESKEKVENGEYEEDQEDEDENEENSGSDKVDEEDNEESDSDDREESPFEIDLPMIETILLSILECTDKTGRLLCPPFRVLQPEDEFPIYYEKIKNPIDLKTIAERGREGKYQTMAELKNDLKLLFSNAQTFSGKGTDIYKDADQLRNCMREEMRKVAEKRIHPLRRQKAQRLVDSLLEESAGSDNYSEDSEEDEDTENAEDPLWQLYWTIRNAKHEKDRTITLADNFLELPSKQMYPDYFDEIQTPVSLFMINKKLKNGDYDMRGLVRDLLQMYSNACEYNMESSEVYIAAKKLEQITLITLKKLSPELANEFASRMYVPPTQVANSNNQQQHRSPPKGRPRIKMEYDSEDSRTPPPVAKRKKSPKKSSEPGYVETRGRKSHFEINEIMKNKHIMLSVWTAVHQFKPDPNGMYWPCGAFIHVPSHKEYPEYYQVIKYPIDMTKIRQRIDGNKYKVAEQMVDDMKVMFSNAREFNEPGSQIHQDACRLQEVMRNSYEAMMSAAAALGNVTPGRLHPKGGKPSAKRRAHEMETDTDEDSRGPPTPTMAIRNPYKAATGFTPQPGYTYQQHQQRIERVINEFPDEEGRMWKMFKAIKEFRDNENQRLLSLNFWKLPTREELPSYYDIIKKPMDLTRIQNKLKSRSYLTLQDVYSDFSLMLSNACKFNEPDSMIYKEAVILQKLLFELKRDLDRGEKVPKIQVELRTIFTSMFATIFMKKDEDGNCYSDSFVELAELLKNKGVPESEWPYTFDQIKINIDKCRYRRLDRFQKDFFNLCETARMVSKVGSEIYDASIVLQKLFISERDKQCKESIKSNAYIVIEKDIDEAIEFEIAQRAKEEANEDEESTSAAAIKRHESEVDVKKVTHDGVEYSPPCYAYISRTDERKSPLHIFRIERVFINENGDEAVQGLWVYRPEETLHLASRKFMKKEVFITPFRDTVLTNRLRGTCLVVSYQTFVSRKIGGFEEDDIYVCESKYYGKPKYFGKFKWPYSEEDEELEIEKRDRLLSPKRLTSKVEKNSEEGEDGEKKEDSDDDDDEADKVCELQLDIDREETLATSSSNNEEVEGRNYFAQIKTKTGKFYTIGQFVLVFNANKALCDVMRIHKLWREKDGSEWFSGCWFARPIETIHDKQRYFFVKEVIAVYRNDEIREISEIQGLCDVLPSKNYIRYRQTDISECDVFVCDAMVYGTKDTPDNCLMFESTIETNAQEIVPMNMDFAKPIRKLKHFRLVQSIPNEELFYFKQSIIMEKEPSPLVKTEAVGHIPLDHLDDMLDDDTDGTESIASSNQQTTAPTPTPKQQQQENENELNITTPTKEVPSRSGSAASSITSPPGTHLVTTAMTLVSSASLAPITPKAVKSKSGYILFSAEVRKRIMQENPDSGFGEVSKIVGIEWKKLSDEQKKHYEQRAEIVAIEKAKLDAIKLAAERALQPGQVRIYQCKWANCDSQFDAESGLNEHIIQHHTSQIIMDSENQYVCMWMTCLRNRKDGKPFPSLPRLHRHMKEKHIPSACRNVYQNQIGKNFFKFVMNGESAQLVNAPYGRLPPPGPVQQVQQQQQQHPHSHQQQNHPQQPIQNGMYHPHHLHQGPSSSQTAPAPQQYQHQVVHQVIHQQQQHPSNHAPQPQQIPHPHQHQQVQQQPQPPQIQQQIIDPGRTIVRAVVPNFVAPPNSIHSRRVLHSEAYLKYIESLATNRQKSVSRWERSLGATHRNIQQSGPSQQNAQRLPAHWIKKNENGRPVAREEDVTRALWKLRDELLQSTCNVLVDRQQ
ncbi:unnamed protein product [Caenorhabditis angaria]|uniref:Protein polybromo-1 n=1 Tax=Caenorhabditis angaria TaxID=860376 RepID=A0A9P1MXE1_9PELO|nr:unnamed protein product [Caenorhabditis angaria]